MATEIFSSFIWPLLLGNVFRIEIKNSSEFFNFVRNDSLAFSDKVSDLLILATSAFAISGWTSLILKFQGMKAKESINLAHKIIQKCGGNDSRMTQLSEMNKVYNLLSDILGISEQYSPDTLRDAIAHVERTINDPSKEVLLNLLGQFQRLRAEGPTDAGKTKSPPAPAKPAVEPEKDPDVWIQEVRAILKDTEFLPDKPDILKLAKKHFGSKITIRKGNRDSRADLISKMVTAFRRMGKTQQLTVYRALKKAYLKKRASSN